MQHLASVLNLDGTSNKEGADLRFIIESSFGVIIKETFQLEKQMTNYEAEYKALLYGLELALKLRV